MIIFSSYGGEIGIAREEVESIIPAVEGMGTSRALPPVEEAPGEAAKAGPGEEQVTRPGKEQAIEAKKEEPLATKEKVLTPEEIRTEERAKKQKEYQKRVKEVAAILRIEELLGRKPSHLSGGEMQRVAVGRAMVRRTRASLMDEPMAGMTIEEKE
ncbi:MAG: ATP-binding cassette domain-containing protein, partial [Deltaproteobacteria bacterium]|nr:ATP-binding cassette domain-containing protein [Deltaproteobacteria bacterium]